MVRSRRPRVVFIVVVGLLIAIGAVGYRLTTTPISWDRVHRIRLVGGRYSDGGQPPTTPAPHTWIIGDAAATAPKVVHGMKFRGDEPGWIPLPAGTQSFQEIAELLSPGSRVSSTYWEPLTAEHETTTLRQGRDVLPGELNVEAWPLALELANGERDTLIVLAVRLADKSRAILPIRSGDANTWCISCTFSDDVEQVPGGWAFTKRSPRRYREQGGGVQVILRRGTLHFEATLRINTGPPLKR